VREKTSGFSSLAEETKGKISERQRLFSFAVAIFLFALTIRLVYINFGLSVENLISDEYYGHRFVTTVASGENPFDRMISYYPGGSVLFESPFLILSGLYAVLDSKSLNTEILKKYILTESPGLFILASRVASAVAGAGIAVLAFFIAFILLGKRKESLLVASFVAIDVLGVSYSHWAKPHIVMNFLGLGALLLSIIFDQTKKTKFLWWSAFLAAAGLGTHMPGLPYLFFPVLAWFRNRSWVPARTVLSVLGLGTLTTLSFYAFNAPGTIQMLRNSLAGFRDVGALAEAAPAMGLERFFFPFTNLWELEPSLVVLSLLAVVLLVISKPFKINYFFYVLVGTAISYTELITVAAMPHVSRWLIPWSLFLTLFSIIVILRRARDASKIVRAALYSVVALALLWNGIQTGRWLTLLKTTTFEEARVWVMEQRSETRILGTELDLNLPLTQQTARLLIKKYIDSSNSPRKDFSFYVSEPQGKEARFNYVFNQYQDAPEILCDSSESILKFDYIIFPYVTLEEREALINCIKKQAPKAYLVKNFGPPDDQLPVLREFDNPTSWRSWWQVGVFGKKIAVIAPH